LESCIIQHVRRHTKDIFYWKDERGREVDLYLPEQNLAIQVVYNLTEDNLKREERALESVKKKFKVKPRIVFLHNDVESMFPSIRAPDFIEGLEDMFSAPKKKKQKK
jgi:predicted AAA+ superfamily ATPase